MGGNRTCRKNLKEKSGWDYLYKHYNLPIVYFYFLKWLISFSGSWTQGKTAWKTSDNIGKFLVPHCSWGALLIKIYERTHENKIVSIFLKYYGPEMNTYYR